MRFNPHNQTKKSPQSKMFMKLIHKIIIPIMIKMILKRLCFLIIYIFCISVDLTIRCWELAEIYSVHLTYNELSVKMPLLIFMYYVRVLLRFIHIYFHIYPSLHNYTNVFFILYLHSRFLIANILNITKPMLILRQ